MSTSLALLKEKLSVKPKVEEHKMTSIAISQDIPIKTKIVDSRKEDYDREELKKRLIESKKSKVILKIKEPKVDEFVQEQQVSELKEGEGEDKKATIIKRKKSPNFISPILYKFDSESKIEWSKLDSIKTKGQPTEIVEKTIQNEKLINEQHEIAKELGLFSFLLPQQHRKQMNINTSKDNKKPNNKLKPEDKEDLTINSGKSLVLLTEAPTSSFIQWSSAIYEKFGTIKKMVSTGYHSPDVWKSVLFQLVYAFAVLQEEQIYMNNFSLENNIYM